MRRARDQTMMLSNALGEIVESDLQSLVETRALESRTLEFKLKLWPKLSDPKQDKKSKAEFIKDIAALANCVGGDIVVGIKTDQGAAVALEGFESRDIDADIARLTQVLEAQTDPPLSHVRMQAICLGNGKMAMVIRVPRSWIAPHRSRLDREFYVRNSVGVSTMDAWQLRTAFLAIAVEKEMRQFRLDRLAIIDQADSVNPYPAPLERGVRVVLHFLPWESFAEPRRLSLGDLRGHMVHLTHSGACEIVPNLDGYIARWNRQPVEGYAQFFRSGAIEVVDVEGAFHGAPLMVTPERHDYLGRTAIQNCVAFMRAANLTAPLSIGLSLTNARGCQCLVSRQRGSSNVQLPVDRLIAPEVVMTDLDQGLESLVHTAFEPLWNGFGLVG